MALAFHTFKRWLGNEPRTAEAVLVSDDKGATWREVPAADFTAEYGGGAGGSQIYTEQLDLTANPTQDIGYSAAGGTLTRVTWIDFGAPNPIPANASLLVVDNAAAGSAVFARIDFTQAELEALPGANEPVEIPILISEIPPGTVLGIGYSNGPFFGIIQVEIA